jgi:hypothetical protein
MSKKSRRRITHPEHKAHRNSILSYKQVQVTGKGDTIKKRILNYLASWEGESLSTRQLEIHLGIEKNCLTAPLLELRLSGKLIVVDKVCATTKKLVMHYQLPEKRKEIAQLPLF